MQIHVYVCKSCRFIHSRFDVISGSRSSSGTSSLNWFEFFAFRNVQLCLCLCLCGVSSDWVNWNDLMLQALGMTNRCAKNDLRLLLPAYCLLCAAVWFICFHCVHCSSIRLTSSSSSSSSLWHFSLNLFSVFVYVAVKRFQFRSFISTQNEMAMRARLNWFGMMNEKVFIVVASLHFGSKGFHAHSGLRH